MQCEYFALEGLTDLVNTIKQVHANLNKNLQIIGLLLQSPAHRVVRVLLVTQTHWQLPEHRSRRRHA